MLDVGAQLGTFTLAMAKQKRHVVAVDPLLENVLRMCKSVQDGGLSDYVTILYAAVSDARGTVTFKREYGNVGGTQVKKTNVKADPNNPDVVETVFLDDVMSHVTASTVVMKVDVETHELHVFNSGKRLFHEKHVPAVLMEWVWHKNASDALPIMQFFGDRGYLPYRPILGVEVALPVERYNDWPNDVLWKKVEGAENYPQPGAVQNQPSPQPGAVQNQGA